MAFVVHVEGVPSLARTRPSAFMTPQLRDCEEKETRLVPTVQLLPVRLVTVFVFMCNTLLDAAHSAKYFATEI